MTLSSESESRDMFNMFWALGNKKQRDQSTFVVITVEKNAMKRAARDKQINRGYSLKY